MRIKIEGRGEYEFPDPNSLTIDETILLEKISGVGIETIIPGEQMPMGAVKAFVMIAVLRDTPTVTEKELADAIGSIRLTDLGKLIDTEQETDARPPEPRPKSEGSTGSSGEDGNEPSGRFPDSATPGFIGPPVSHIGSTSGRETSAA